MSPTPSPNNSRLVQNIKIRRKEESLGEIPTRSLIEKIRAGELVATDEFSGDGRLWTTLGQHPQLAPFFEEKKTSSAPPGFHNQLEQMAGLLDELNTP